MATMDDDGPQTTRARYPLAHLRQILQEARDANNAERIHVALIDTVDGLVSHVERQARAIDELRSDLLHKQGIVTKIGGGEFQVPVPNEKLREFASSSNGDRWFLGRDETTGIAQVVHRANQPSGGAVSHIELGAFLNRGPSTPEILGLLQLIGSLVA
ncbi:MAG: hypothetical protein ACRYGP_17595 [Janthinobacterium lividum]